MENPHPLLTVIEIATFLKVSPKTIYYWVGRQEIPFMKIGRHLRFDVDAVLSNFKSKMPQEPCQSLLVPLISPLRACSLKSESGPSGATPKGASNGYC